MRICCQTQFDITQTGVTGHFRSRQLPFVDLAGQTIGSTEDWDRARNQQRNWETLTQVISLRTQMFDISAVEYKDDLWQFEFSVEPSTIFCDGDDNLAVLKKDCDMVPMLIGLGESSDVVPYIKVDFNTRFIDISINTNYE